MCQPTDSERLRRALSFFINSEEACALVAQWIEENPDEAVETARHDLNYHR